VAIPLVFFNPVFLFFPHHYPAPIFWFHLCMLFIPFFLSWFEIPFALLCSRPLLSPSLEFLYVLLLLDVIAGHNQFFFSYSDSCFSGPPQHSSLLLTSCYGEGSLILFGVFVSDYVDLIALPPHSPKIFRLGPSPLFYFSLGLFPSCPWPIL